MICNGNMFRFSHWIFFPFFLAVMPKLLEIDWFSLESVFLQFQLLWRFFPFQHHKLDVVLPTSILFQFFLVNDIFCCYTSSCFFIIQCVLYQLKPHCFLILAWRMRFSQFFFHLSCLTMAAVLLSLHLKIFHMQKSFEWRGHCFCKFLVACLSLIESPSPLNSQPLSLFQQRL